MLRSHLEPFFKKKSGRGVELFLFYQTFYFFVKSDKTSDKKQKFLPTSIHKHKVDDAFLSINFKVNLCKHLGNKSSCFLLLLSLFFHGDLLFRPFCGKTQCASFLFFSCVQFFLISSLLLLHRLETICGHQMWKSSKEKGPNMSQIII